MQLNAHHAGCFNSKIYKLHIGLNEVPHQYAVYDILIDGLIGSSAFDDELGLLKEAGLFSDMPLTDKRRILEFLLVIKLFNFTTEILASEFPLLDSCNTVVDRMKRWYLSFLKWSLKESQGGCTNSKLSASSCLLLSSH